MAKTLDLTGMKAGRLTVERFSHRVFYGIYGRMHWHCVCECGKRVIVAGQSLRTGNTKSCGCLRGELYKSGGPRKTHGATKTRTYTSWFQMKRRCYDHKNPEYKNYGGRGIRVYRKWRMSFESFLAYIGPRPLGTSLDRIDNSRGYFPGNVRWATRTQQSRNTRSNVRVKVDGVVQTLSEWEEIYGLPRGIVSERLIRGWSADRAVKTPPKKV